MSFFACLVGVASPSILGGYEWVCKDLLACLKTDDLGFSTSAICELVKGMMEAGVGSGDLGPFEASDSPQTVLVEVSGSLGYPSKTIALLARVFEKVGATLGGMGVTEEVGGSLSVIILADQPISLS